MDGSDPIINVTNVPICRKGIFKSMVRGILKIASVFLFKKSLMALTEIHN